MFKMNKTKGISLLSKLLESCDITGLTQIDDNFFSFILFGDLYKNLIKGLEKNNFMFIRAKPIDENTIKVIVMEN